MRIAILHRAMEAEFREHGEGGWTCYQLARAVARLGHEVKVLTQSPRVTRLESRRLGELAAWICPERARIPHGWPTDKVLKWVYGYRKVASDAVWLSRFVRREGPFDVIWAMSEEPDALVCGVASSTGLRIPYVVQIQALRYSFGDGAPRFTHHRALGKGFSRASLVVANSPLVEGLLRDRYRVPPPKLAWLPPNLTEHFLSGLGAIGGRPPSGFPRGPVLFLGAINAKKAPDVFLAAAAQLVRAGIGAQFRLIGGITEPRSRFAKAWPGLVRAFRPEGTLELTGHLPAAEISREISGASVVVLPSRLDEFSRAALECLVLGVPVIVTSAVGAAYVVERDGSGLVVPPGDASALARAIGLALSDERFALAARQRAASLRAEFSPAALAEGWTCLLERAAIAR